MPPGLTRGRRAQTKGRRVTSTPTVSAGRCPQIDETHAVQHNYVSHNAHMVDSPTPSPDQRVAETTVLLGDTSRLALVGMQALLANAVDIVGAAPSYNQLASLLPETGPDIALVEFDLLYQSDAGAFGGLRELAAQTHVVVTAEEMLESDVLRTFGAGARGVVIKDERPEKLLEAIAAARIDGQRYIDPRLAAGVLDSTRKGDRAAREPFGLTVQERRVVALLGQGHTNSEIAHRLGISPETVRTHIRNCQPKLGAYDRVHAARIAASHNLSRTPPPAGS